MRVALDASGRAAVEADGMLSARLTGLVEQGRVELVPLDPGADWRRQLDGADVLVTLDGRKRRWCDRWRPRGYAWRPEQLADVLARVAS